MFSIVIPLYNKELSIKNTIQSVLNQNCQDFEIVVVNDGSTDSSVKIIESIKDNRIRLIQQENQGVSAARNRGIKEANYEWIALLDGDDLWKVNHLEEITKMMALFPNEKIYVTSFEYSDGRVMFKHARQTPIFKIENYFKEAIKENLIWTSIVVVNRECFDEVGMFNQELNYGEDLDLWARLARRFEIVKTSNITAIYRLEAENRSNNSFDIRKSRIFNLNLSDTESEDEYMYYKVSIIRVLRGYLINKKLKEFILLFSKHRKYINLVDILKVRSL